MAVNRGHSRGVGCAGQRPYQPRSVLFPSW